MGKYDPLLRFLEASDKNRVFLSFGEIERLLGFPLPPSSKNYRAWWSNNPSNNVMTKAWLAAGYRTEQVDLEQGKLCFSRIDNGASVQVHPILGCAQGTVNVPEHTDLTAPVDPSWCGPNELMSR
ncbi:MAG: hypothetical protein GY948_24205 [Alphaproteobacteria bacterium]|nr:hypothetical protein [Alphaproteobacteria bacterium]